MWWYFLILYFVSLNGIKKLSATSLSNTCIHGFMPQSWSPIYLLEACTFLQLYYFSLPPPTSDCRVTWYTCSPGWTPLGCLDCIHQVVDNFYLGIIVMLFFFWEAPCVVTGVHVFVDRSHPLFLLSRVLFVLCLILESASWLLMPLALVNLHKTLPWLLLAMWHLLENMTLHDKN